MNPPWEFWYVALLGHFGLAYIVGHSKISLPVRLLLGGVDPDPMTGSPGVPAVFGRPGKFLCDLLECPACFGFWAGLVMGATMLRNPMAPLALQVGWAIWCGFVVSGSNFIIGRAMRLI